MPRFGSLFAGIGGGDLGLERAGWSCLWQVEIDPWRRKILERHWPDMPRWDDVRTWPPTDCLEEAHVDLIIGGFPCQDLSVAGKRQGLAGERSGLFFEFARVVSLLRPRWLLVENVPGLLSSHKGQDMGIVLEAFSDLGYGLAWRVLDSQYFGVPQRRRRIYIVGHLGAPCPPEILFEPEGGGGDSETGGKAGEEVAAPLGASTTSFGGRRNDLDNETYVLTGFRSAESGANTLGAFKSDTAPTLDQEGLHAIAQPLCSNRWGGSDSHGDEGNVVLESRSRGGESRTFDKPNLRASYGDGKGGQRVPYVCAPTDPDGVREATGVPRWLDPCPRCPDGRRYAALGDAMTVNVVEWIGRRLLSAHQELYGGRECVPSRNTAATAAS
jgi:hypothetical protein